MTSVSVMEVKMLERKVEVRVRERRVGEEKEKPSREGVLRKCIAKQEASSA